MAIMAQLRDLPEKMAPQLFRLQMLHYLATNCVRLFKENVSTSFAVWVRRVRQLGAPWVQRTLLYVLLISAFSPGYSLGWKAYPGLHKQKSCTEQ